MSAFQCYPDTFSPTPKRPEPNLIGLLAIISAIICFVLFPLMARAGPPEQVAVAEAIVWADQHATPAIPADSFTSAVSGPLPAALTDRRVTEDVIARPLGITFSEQPKTDTRIVWHHYQNSTIEESNRTGRPILVVIGAAWCNPCLEMERTTFRDMQIVDIVESNFVAVHIDGDDEPDYVRGFNTSVYPSVLIVEKGKVTKRATGKLSPDQMADFLAVESKQLSGGTGQLAGTIHASSKVRDLLNWWKLNIGEGVQLQGRWDRSGAQEFPLLAKGDWSHEAILGQYGHLQVSAVGSRFPLDAIGLGYRVNGNDATFYLDPVTLKGFGQYFEPQNSLASMGPSQFGPMTWYTVFTVLKDIYSLLHPTCDLQLGGNIKLTAVLAGDTLTIDFQQCPSIKLVALFTFQLQVKRVDISEHLVRLVFGGSRLVKERSFKVD